MIEAMKQALEKIANVNAMDYEYQRWAREALAIAELESQDGVCQHCAGKGCVACDAREQEPDKYAMDIECTKCGAKQSGVLTVNTHQPQRTEQGEPVIDKSAAIRIATALGWTPPEQERNFCPRCGKRTNYIHTCTPPRYNT